MKILLTGFEPFGGSSVNPSIQAVRIIAQEPPGHIELHTAMLPVDRVNGPATLILAIESFKPELVLCLGQATGRQALSVERVAVNLLDYNVPDNSGAIVKDEPIVIDGPAAYFVTLPVRQMLTTIRDAGVPCELSLSAGAFLCNQVLYTLLHHIAVNRLPIRGGFIHVPALPEQVMDRIVPSMGIETIAKGIRAAMDVLALEKR